MPSVFAIPSIEVSQPRTGLALRRPDLDLSHNVAGRTSLEPS